MPKDTHLEYRETASKKVLSVGVTDDCKRLYVGFRTRRGDFDVMQMKKQQAAELGGSILNWASKIMIGDEDG